MSKKKRIELKVEMIELLPEEIIPYKQNNKDHRTFDIDEIAKSIKMNGYIQPITVDENNIILTGHGRLLALKKLGYEKIRVLQVTGFENENQKRDYRIRDNTTNGLAQWNVEFLTLELYDLGDTSSDLISHLNTQGIELNIDLGIFANQGVSIGVGGEDDVPPTPEEILVKVGDIFKLGEHTLACGDSLDPEMISSIMEGNQADMIFTDPPYNINYKGRGETTGTDRGIENDNMSDEAFSQFLFKSFSRYNEFSKPSAPAYVFHAISTQIDFQTALEKTGWKIKNQIIWMKPTFVMGWGDYRWQHEPCFYAGKKEGGTTFYGNRAQSTKWDFYEGKTDEDILASIKKSRKAREKGYTSVWEMKKDSTAEYIHPTQKPVDLITRAIINSSRPGDLVIDFFAGSGSTLIACEKNKRKCITIDLDPGFVQRIIRRYYEFTGGEMTIRCTNREIDLEKIVKNAG